MAMNVTDNQVSAAINSKNRDELVALRALLVTQKKDIEAQLADDKGQMLEERAGHLERGVHPRKAQALATASTDHDWRGRAVMTTSQIDGRLARINSMLKALNATPVEKNKQTGAPEPRPVDVLALRGSAEEVAEQIRTSGKKVAAMAPYDGALIVVLWANS